MSLLATAAFLHVFAFGRRRYLPLFMVLLAGMLYTHNWGLFLGAGLALGLIPCWYVSEVRSSFWRDALIGFGGVGLLYLPWLPTLLHQVQHTGAPWLNPPTSARRCRSRSRFWAAARRPSRWCSRRARASRRSSPAAWRTRSATALLSGATIMLGTLAVAWLVSQVSPAWTTRYLGVLLGPMLLIGALGLARAGNLGMVALVIIVGIWAIPKSYGLENKSNASDLRNDAVPELHEGTSSSRCSRSRGRCSPITSSSLEARPTSASGTRRGWSTTTASWTGRTGTTG